MNLPFNHYIICLLTAAFRGVTRRQRSEGESSWRTGFPDRVGEVMEERVEEEKEGSWGGGGGWGGGRKRRIRRRRMRRRRRSKRKRYGRGEGEEGKAGDQNVKRVSWHCYSCNMCSVTLKGRSPIFFSLFFQTQLWLHGRTLWSDERSDFLLGISLFVPAVLNWWWSIRTHISMKSWPKCFLSRPVNKFLKWLNRIACPAKQMLNIFSGNINTYVYFKNPLEKKKGNHWPSHKSRPASGPRPAGWATLAWWSGGMVRIRWHAPLGL